MKPAKPVGLKRLEPVEYRRRRRQLLNHLQPGDIAIVPTAPVRLRNRDVEYRYRADSDFYYLTGFPEPESVAVFVPGRAHGQFVLFCRERDPEKETWHGRRAGVEGACATYGADDAFPITDIDDILPGLLENRNRIFYTMGCNPEFDQKLVEWVKQVRGMTRAGIHAPNEFISLENILHEMRLIKSRREIDLMRAVARITAAAHRRAMQACRPGMMEFQLEAELVHEFMRQGAVAPAYAPIVGGGANGCILHYTENDAPLRAGDLVLIDAGGELDHYAADITRTFPVNGAYSPAQRAVYEVVLAAQAAAIAKVRPGAHWNEPHDAAVRALTEGLVELGLLRGRVAKLIKDEAYKRFYMHRTGHWIGMDVHDVGEYRVGGAWRELEPGMVLTIEPGLYIAPDGPRIARKWQGIGIRIEDDVLVTARGCEVLTADAPKGVDEIEALMSG